MCWLVRLDLRGIKKQSNELKALIWGCRYEQALEQGSEHQVQAPAARALVHPWLGHTLCRLRRLTEALEQLNLAETLFVSLRNRGLAAQTMELRALALQIAEQPEVLSLGLSEGLFVVLAGDFL